MLERDVLLLKKVLETSNTQQMVQLPRAKSQMVEVLLQLSGKVVHGSAAEHYLKYKSVHEYLQQHMPSGMIEKFEKLVIEPMVEWIAYLAEVRAEQSDFEKVRIAFDHYRDKMSTLVEQKRQLQIKGKVVDKSTDEKLTRNLEKLQQSETAYQEARDRFVGRMLRCFEDANQRLDNVLLRVMQYETAVSTDVEKSIAAFKPHTSVLSTTVRDRRAIASPTEQLGWCVEKARTARQNGTKLDLEKFILKEGTGPASGAAPSSSFVPSISRARSGSQTLRDEEEAAAVAAPVVSMSAFTSAKSVDAGKSSASAARPPPSVGNPFGGSSVSSSSSEDKPPLPARRAAAPEPVPSAPPPAAAAPAAAAKASLFGGWGNPFGAASAKTEPATGAFELGDGDETPRKPAGSRGRTDEDPTPDPNFTRELETPAFVAPEPAPPAQPAKTGRAHTAHTTAPSSTAGSSSSSWDGGFADAPSNPPAAASSTGGGGAAASASFDPWGGGGGFGATSSAPVPAPQPASQPSFGDFGFEVAKPSQPAPLNPLNPFASPPPAAKPAATTASWDDFGSFGAANPAASSKAAVSDPNDPFGGL